MSTVENTNYPTYNLQVQPFPLPSNYPSGVSPGNPLIIQFLTPLGVSGLLSIPEKSRLGTDSHGLAISLLTDSELLIANATERSQFMRLKITNVLGYDPVTRRYFFDFDNEQDNWPSFTNVGFYGSQQCLLVPVTSGAVGGGGSVPAFVDLTDVTPLVPVTGQAVHYNGLTSKWEQASELVVDPSTRDVISTTTGLFSQVSSGSASIGSIGAEANVQGETALNLASVHGTVLLVAQDGDVDINATEDITIVGDISASMTSPGPVTLSSGDILSFNGDNGANITASAAINITNDLSTDPITISSLTNQVVCQGTTGATLQSLTGNVVVNAVSGNLNLTASDFVNITSNTQEVILTSLLDDVVIKGGQRFQNADGTITKLTMNNTQITTSIPSYESSMVNTSLATKLYVDTAVAPISNKVTKGGDTGADLEVGTLSNNYLWLKTFGSNKFFVERTTATLGCVNQHMYIGGYFSTGGPYETNINGPRKTSSGGVSGNLHLNASVAPTVGTAGNVLIRRPSDNLGFTFNGTSGLLSSTIPTYETLVLADNDMPNKKYVDDEVAVASGLIKYPLRTDQDKFSFKIRSTGNSPASGEVMLLDNSNVNQFATLVNATKVRFSKTDANGITHLGGSIYDDISPWILIAQDSTFASSAFTYSSAPTDGGTYWEFSLINPSINSNTYVDDQPVFWIRDRQYNLNDINDVDASTQEASDWLQFNGTNWISRRAVYGQYYWTQNTTAENNGATIATSATVKLGNNTTPIATTAVVSKNLTHTSPNTYTYTGLVDVLVQVTYNVSMYTGDNDRSFTYSVRKNGVLNSIPQSRCAGYSRNNIAGADDSSKTFIVSLSNGDYLEIYATNTAAATELTISELSMTIKHLDYV